MLDQYRKKIDAIDKKILALFEKRMETAKKVGEYKKERGMEIFCPEREKAVIENRTEKTKNPALKTYTKLFFEEIMRISRLLQATIVEESTVIPFEIADFKKEDLRVVYPGTEGSYSQEAQKKFFPDAKNVIKVKTFTEVAKMVSRGEADFGVLPFENNSSGAIADTLDLIQAENLYIAGETYVPICHCLMGTTDAVLSDIKEIYSHHQGFLQSSKFIESLGEKVRCNPMENTALAAKFVKESGEKQKAAIASKLAAESFGLKILEEDIQENSENTTRFVVISNKLTSGKDAEKISAAFSLKDKSGALCDALAIFARNGVNLLHIESRPLKEKDFSYVFYIDFEGNLSMHNVKTVITQMKESGVEFHILGNYKLQNTKD